ncbi:hypothetical protein ACFQWF_18315 [Methylorubrum suomiense]
MATAQEVVSREIGVLSQRLVKLEAVAAALVQSRHKAHPAPIPQNAPDNAEAVAELETRLASGIEEVTAEIGLLSGIVRELAAVVSNQDGDIARLKADRERAVASPRFRPLRRPGSSRSLPRPPVSRRRPPPASCRGRTCRRRRASSPRPAIRRRRRRSSKPSMAKDWRSISSPS